MPCIPTESSSNFLFKTPTKDGRSMSDQRRLMPLVLALLVAESAAVSYATMGECDANCSPSIYECSSDNYKRFSCSFSVWFIIVLVVVGLALFVGIPTVCFGM
jgi:hypothetical protein